MTGPLYECWAKTDAEGKPGISVRDHCLNVGSVAAALLDGLPDRTRSLLPAGSVLLAALHDVGKITVGFQAKCPLWLQHYELPKASPGELALSVSDHALVSQVFVQRLLSTTSVRLWAVAVGAHHGRPKGRNVALKPNEAIAGWAEENRMRVLEELQTVFGPLPTLPPDALLAPYHSDVWFLAGLISVADWIGSNETWFSPKEGLHPDEARRQANKALHQIGWPGGALRQTAFSTAFSNGSDVVFHQNPLQKAAADATGTPGIVIIEGPMGCGKTEAALFAAQQLISSGQQHGIYFALPTQVTSNRIYKRVERFLRNTLADDASFRLAHGNAWLEDDFDLRLCLTYPVGNSEEGEEVSSNLREARSWFSTGKQALLAPYGVGTIDQALQGVVAVKHFFVRRFALAGKVVILDEVHSYDMYTGALIAALIRELVNLSCSVIILSATLTATRRRELLAAAGVAETADPTAYPLVSSGVRGGECRHVSPEWSSCRKITLKSAVISEEQTLDELVTRAEGGQHVLWIRNTVIEAQNSFRIVSACVREGAVRVGLLHSRFPFQPRAELENDWLERLGRNRPADDGGSILIATQVVEQSVDIDLDFIVSDLAPTDMLLQRVGRLWRHERPRREATAPEFWIRFPDFPEAFDAADLKKALGRSARVYAPYVLLRTAKVWRGRKEIRIPSDIRPLLEATYADPDASEPEPWRALQVELETEKAKLVANAEAATLVLGRPMLQDEDEVLTRRQGAPTTPLVLLKSVTPTSHSSVVVVGLDGSNAEISEHEWRRASARFLHHWLVRAPRWMIANDAQVPRWLSLHGPAGVKFAIVRDDGRCVFGDADSSMTYDARLGIFAERTKQRTPQRNDDDEFDY